MRRVLLAFTLLLGGLLLQPALAGPFWGRQQVDSRRDFIRRPPPPVYRMPPPPGPIGYGPGPRRFLSPAEAAQRAQQMNGGGRVLAIDSADAGYRVRVLKDGEVRSLVVPRE